jgi:peptidoglycan lytic transglycosylase D
LARMQEASPADAVSLKWHTVKRGETLLTVARKLGVRKTDLAEANYLSVNSRITVGQKLIVPREATTLMSARTDRTIPVADSRPLPVEPGLVAQGSTNSDRVKVIYQVKRGDTLASIAKLFKTNVAALRTWNRIPGSHIVVGARLVVYALSADRNLG